jgi:cellulose 1,4-beta-cellobiosidase
MLIQAFQANLNMTYGACCNEMDIWEANNNANAFTPHPCNVTGPYACEEPLCGNANRYAGVCDKDGCDFNTYRNGVHNYYGDGKGNTVDTSKPFTVTTQFVASGVGPNQVLSQIRRLYVQGGKVITNAAVNVTGIPHTNAISDSYCSVQKQVMGGQNAFAAQGGMKGMGGALQRGMVLAMSIWDDSGSYMGWLDTTYPTDSDPSSPGVARGSCPTTSGHPADIIAQYPDASVTFSNIKVGEIGSTYSTRHHH